ncbi:hypothetical protein MIMGU_mgv1a002861mg [Erythranthe guttata]|uniref:C2H2-type domain-containing protein n=1 Tax=Erythranthe guttata TaxID=4155 RepID=A0A022RQZ3_ERYGU|nr:PREDICTED: probable protein arginine N-methyltransferase 3 [Erythranthe guttata]EYU42922.1 hypothetical protein MIMGU_mgv1a002861mg [Erythranthe guttata]|eukprot:XP_012830679.1 PREDICTED: probable protein arginine N-methyltransferase 3 [Erythranthe guttata]
MATHRVEEDNQYDGQVNSKRHHSDSDSDSEEEEIDDQNWDDWEDENDAVEDQNLNPKLLCLFCDSHYDSSSCLFEHCASAHLFDYGGIKKAYSLEFYKCFKLINYIRSQVAVNKCWSCGVKCSSNEDMQKHLHAAVNFDGSSFPWDDDRYLHPFLQDDSLLYSFDEDEEEENDEADAMSVDTKELASYLSQFERIDIHDEGASSNGFRNGGKDADLSSNKDTNTANTSKTPIDVDARVHSENGVCKSSSLKIAANEIKDINKNYFGAYSSFGIHRDMISDKVRTDAYKQAITENPSLVRNAVVMDVGCGTGILSLFAARAGASRVIAIEASDKMAAVATQIAKDNNLLQNGISSERNGVIEVVQGMVEELENADHIQPHSVDVLVSEWMGYCLLYESMLTSVLFARDKWLKIGGAMLPDTATMFAAGFGRGATSIPFWENVYGFNMSSIGREVVEDAARFPIVDVIDSCHIVTTTKVLQNFDLVSMQPKQMDFTAEIDLEPKLVSTSNNPTNSKPEPTWCYGVVVWFETGFTDRFCRENPVNLSTSPYEPSTHWSQTVLTFREPIAMASISDGEKSGEVGTSDCPAVRIHARISAVRASKHRSIDISMELTGFGAEGQKRNWPAQIFNLN